jgi:hypothetical protein
MRSIEGLQYENISLTFVPAEDFARGTLTAAPAPGGGPVKAFIGGVSMLFVIVLGGVGYVWNRYQIGRAAMSGAERLSASHPGPWTSQVK